MLLLWPKQSCINLTTAKGKVLPVHTMKALRGTGIAPFILNLSSRADWSTSHPGRSTPRKEPWYPLKRKLCGPQSWSGWFREEKISCLCRDSNSDRPACRYSLYLLHHPSSNNNKVLNNNPILFYKFMFGKLLCQLEVC